MRQNLLSQLFNAFPNLVFSSIVATGLVVFARPIFLPAFGTGINSNASDNIRPIEAIAIWLLPVPLDRQDHPNKKNLNVTPADQYQAGLLRQQGLADRQAGSFNQAIASLEQSTQLDPTNINGYVLLGWTQHLAGDHDSAAQSLWQAISLDPRSVEAFNALGIVYLVQGDLNHAILSHSWAAMLKPDNEIAYYNLSLAYQRQQVYDWAIAYGKAATILEPYNPHPFVALAICYWTRGQQGDQEQAIDVYRQVLIIDDRYGDPNFLDYLDEAGFSGEQIQLAKAILNVT